jgi:hypothetical protein
MQASEVIEMYIDDTVRLLPRRQRRDVASELRSMLGEELRERASQSQRPADESLALALVRDYGHPTEVAARYHPQAAIIDPSDTGSFMRAAFLGAGVLMILSVLSKLRPSPPGTAQQFVQIGILAWLGVLVLAFAAKSWIRRQWPATAVWKPRDRDRVSRVGALVLVPVATCVLVLYAAPAFVLDRISGGGIDTSWAAYTADFQRLGLPMFIGLMVGLLALHALAAIQGGHSLLTRRIGIGLNLAVACLTLAFATQGHIFTSSQVDQIARDVLALVALIYVPSVGAQIYGELGRIGRSGAAKDGYTIVPRAAAK